MERQSYSRPDSSSPSPSFFIFFPIKEFTDRIQPKQSVFQGENGKT